MKKTVRLLALVLSLVLVVGVFAACNNDTQPSTSTSGSGTSTSGSGSTGGGDVVWPETLKIAYMGPITGNYSLYGAEYSHALEMMTEKINEAGGIASMGGAKIVYEIHDDKNDAKESVIVANKIISDPDVILTIGPFSTGNGLAVKPVFNEAKMPLISGSVSNPTFAEGVDYCFSASATQADMMKLYGDFITKNLGYTKCATLWANSEWGQTVYDNLDEFFTAAGGEIVYQENYEIGTKDFKPQLAKYKNQDFEFFYIAGHIAECGPIINQIKELQFEQPIITSNSLLMQEFIDVVKENGEGIIMLSYFSPGDDNPQAFEDYKAEYLARYTDIKSIDPHIFGMGDIMNMLKVVFEKIGEEGTATTVAQMREAVALTIPTLTYDGLISEYTFTPDGQAQKPMVPCVIKDGAFVTWSE